MEHGTELTMKTLKPFWGRVLVIESPVDEATRESGLIVPVTADGVQRGVVQDVDLEWSDDDRKAAAELLAPGTVVYFRHGTRIADVIVLDINDILAYEAS